MDVDLPPKAPKAVQKAPAAPPAPSPGLPAAPLASKPPAAPRPGQPGFDPFDPAHARPPKLQIVRAGERKSGGPNGWIFLDYVPTTPGREGK